MKAVLLSIKPHYCELIASGKKTLEVRKSKPKLEPPFKCYIYCTNGKDTLYKVNGQIVLNNCKVTLTPCGDVKETIYKLNGTVIGEFVCDSIIKADYGSYCRLPRVQTALDPLDLMSYADNKTVYGWHISDLKIYDKPKDLSEFRKCCKNDLYCESCAMYNENSKFCGNSALQIARPPQSWCYVEI